MQKQLARIFGNTETSAVIVRDNQDQSLDE